MAVIDRPLILPKLAFLTAWSMLDIGEMPPAFGTGLQHWTSADGRRELESRTMVALNDLGLARNDRLNELWRSTVAVLAGAGREYYAFSNFAGGQACSVLIAAGDGDAIRAVIDDKVVAQEPIEDRWFATALLDTLPDVPGAVIRPTRVAQDDLDSINEVMRRPRRAVHQIYVARRDSDGERCRSMPISAIDLEESGRVLVYTDGDDNLVMIPGTAREFVLALNNTYAALAEP
ncbi:ESX secretion-associated protein EspG [Amycolatopsis sp. NPDC051128]|uniref:ESX secretion-associated protein EspG n=1 Tax=Amycolatopsis sp. NPDC051128 TaxID=3155412 RepID=UPI003447D328